VLGSGKGESQLRYSLTSTEPLIVNDFRSEFRFQVPAVVHELGLVSSMSVIVAACDQPFGVLTVHTGRQRTFTHDDARFLQAVASVLATAIEHRRVETVSAQKLVALQVANEQLQHLNKTQNEFVSTVSHEFRTTLTSIRGFSELMRDEDFTLKEIKEYASDINVDALRLDRMITELLDLDRMKSGRMKLNLDQVDLNALITDVVDRARPTTPNHTFGLQLDHRLPLISSDCDKLTQVITNLLSNALKYSPAGGKIILSSQFENDLAHIYVQDHGIGIPSHALEQVFDPYSRIESGTTRYITGTGLGLPIVRQIVQMHGGQVWAESVLGQGSIFHFTLPFHPAARKV
jgi:signal transduction histidine kinase